MLVRLPMRIELTSPRMTALNHTLDSAPITTSPITTAVSSINALSAMVGVMPWNERIIAGHCRPCRHANQGVALTPFPAVLYADPHAQTILTDPSHGYSAERRLHQSRLHQEPGRRRSHAGLVGESWLQVHDESRLRRGRHHQLRRRFGPAPRPDRAAPRAGAGAGLAVDPALLSVPPTGR